ncbi:hypothetical protein H0G69_10620 (plasmid) [Limosilactobacillus mucosae]|uniref:hypothetical protein n=1 Tax=Limosilactobacillus mucosae TaxID=97478 RepID=UPI0015D54459|nr:hypothetical protein [Limosilactobacillus mucosae]QLI95449.1 hypothetical protein H0G69_10620 [Limosilactobacillus mucosae]
MATTDDMKSIAETIRKAQYGKDVREAIAKGFELLAAKQDKVDGFWIHTGLMKTL